MEKEQNIISTISFNGFDASQLISKNRNPIKSQIIDKNNSFCNLKQCRQKYETIFVSHEDPKIASINFYTQQSQLMINLLEELQKIQYNQLIPSQQCLIIGFLLNYCSVLCVKPLLSSLQEKSYDSLIKEINEISAQKRRFMSSCKSQIDLKQLKKIEFYKNNQDMVKDTLNEKFNTYPEIKLTCRKFLNKIYKELVQKIKKQQVQEIVTIGIIRVITKIIYIITLHMINLENKTHLKYYHEWRKNMDNKVEIKDIEIYIRQCEPKLLLEDITYLLKLFF